MSPPPPKLALLDVMILIATTGMSLSIYMALDNGLFNGQRFFFGLFQGAEGVTTVQRISRVGGAFSILLILFGGWTLVVPALPLRRYRTRWHRLSRQPGISGCLAAVSGMLVWAGVAGATLLLRDLLENHAALPPAFWIQSPVFDGLIVCAGTSVASVWIVQIVTGRWRPRPNAFDRLGRGVSVLWLVVGMTFAARMLLH